VLNEVTQGCITQSAQDLANKTREKQQLSLQINDKTRDQDKLKQRHSYLSNEIKNCIPMVRGKDGETTQKYSSNDVTILPGQHRKYNVPNGIYEDVNPVPVRSKNALFCEEKNAINYNSIVEQPR